jgi:hypothetical protein
MRLSGGALIVLLLTSSSAFAEIPKSVSKQGSSLYLGGYDAREPKSMSEIPPLVRSRLESHLRERLGETIFRRLVLDGGQIVDVPQLLRSDPSANDYQWEIPSFRLSFKLVLPEAGISSYVATIELRADGSVIQDIDLPCFACAPDKLRVLPLAEAAAIATDAGFSKTDAAVEIDYQADIDSLVWIFSQQISDDGNVIKYDRMSLDAHTGAIITRGNTEAIR